MDELISLNDLDFVAASESPVEIQMKDAGGNLMPLWFSILGDESEKVQKFGTRKINEQRRLNAFRMKKGKTDEFDPVEGDIDFMIDAAAVRVVGWRGTKEPYTPELARSVLKRNPHFRRQIMEESGNVSNFTQS